MNDSAAGKTLGGVIRNWELSLDGRVRGICVKHTNYKNGITDNEPITTSRVLAIWDSHGVKIAETLNSLYVLVP